MCPACIATMTWIAAGAAGVGSVAALAINKRCSKDDNTKKGKDHVPETVKNRIA